MRLTAALGIDDAALLSLIELLADQLDVDVAADDEANRGTAMTRDNLSCLYRHARLARLLEVEISELGALLRLLDIAQVRNRSTCWSSSNCAGCWPITVVTSARPARPCWVTRTHRSRPRRDGGRVRRARQQSCRGHVERDEFGWRVR